jgi:hypothetical protein
MSYLVSVVSIAAAAIALMVAVDARPASAAVACGPNGCVYAHPYRYGYHGVYGHPYARGYAHGYYRAHHPY